MRKGALAFVVEIAEDFFLRLWLRVVDTVGTAVGIPVSIGLSTCLSGGLARKSDGKPGSELSIETIASASASRALYSAREALAGSPSNSPIT